MPKNESVADNFRGLPMSELIGAPLAAACKAQVDLGHAMVSFIQALGFKEDKKTTQTIDFELTRPVDNGTRSIGSQTLTIHAPLLGLVPIPALLIDNVTIQFTMTVTDVNKDTNGTDSKASVDVEASYGLGFFSASAKVHGEVSSHRENTRETDKSAKYDVRVEAKQQPPTEGMSKLMDLLASATAPIKITAQA